MVADAREIPCLRLISPVGIPCFMQAFEVVYIYGQTELKAELRWMEEVRDEFRLSRLCNYSDNFRTQDEEKRYPHPL